MQRRIYEKIVDTNDRKKRNACFIYYQRYNSLIYREANALLEDGFNIDIICLRRTRKEKVFQRFSNQHLFLLQAREAAERHTICYFLWLLLFFVKASILVSFMTVLKRYSLIHVTAPPDIMVFSALVPKLLGSKIILDIHDISPELYMRKMKVRDDSFIIKLLKGLERVSTQFADHVITVTGHWKSRLVSRSVRPDKCSVILNVPCEELFKAYRSQIRKGVETFNLYYHGSIEEHFGVDTMIKAMPVISKYIPNVNLHVYGNKKGRLFEECKFMTIALGLKKIVIFHEGIPFYELPKILVDADIGIVPTKGSVFSDEAVSMKSFEYLALGIPIVISKTKAHQFYYNSSMVKFFEPDNSHDLAIVVIELYRDPHKRERLVANSREFMKRNGWNNHAKKIYLDIANRLISASV